MRASAVAVTMSVLALGACAGDPGPGEPYGFVGIWDCGVSTLVLTNTSYNNGSATVPIRTVTQSGRNFMLYLQGGSRVALGAVTETGLTWVSGTSGDQLNCRRVN